MNPIPRRPALLLLLLILALAAGCARSIPNSYYLLDSGEPPFNAADLPAQSLRLADVSLPDYLDRKDIVRRRSGDTHLDVAAVHQWAEPLDKGLRRALREILVPRLARAGRVLLPEGETREGVPALVVDIQRFDGDFDADAHISARWQLRDADGGILAQGIHAASLPVGPDYASLTRALSSLARGLGEHLAGRCAEVLASPARPAGTPARSGAPS